MTGVQTCALPIYSDSGKSVSGKPIQLVLWYQSGKTRLQIDWYDYLSGYYYFGEYYHNETPAMYRLGTEEARKTHWAIVDNRTATSYVARWSFFGVTTSKSTIKFIGELMKVDSFVAKVAPHHENPTVAAFDVRGLKAIVEQYDDVLNWIEEN